MIISDTKNNYDCPNMINYYVCAYTNKYASEMLYLLRKSNKLKEMQEYRILSIGCGAAPDLMAFEEYIHETNYSHKTGYYGIDMNRRWENIHKEIENYANKCDLISWIEFEYVDAMQYLEQYNILDINVIVLQYLISYFYNNGQIKRIQDFFESLVDSVIVHKRYDEPCIVLINDVNSCYRGRDFFTDMVDILKANHARGHRYRFYFDYNAKYKYGERHESYETLFNLRDVDLDIYERWNHCSSAQMLIEID